jgi:hypothetical protein
MPIFPLIRRSVVFLVDGVIDEEQKLAGRLYPFEQFPWNTKPGVAVWSKELAVQEYQQAETSQGGPFKLSTLLEKQLEEYFHRTCNEWWVCLTTLRSPKAPAIKGKFIPAPIEKLSRAPTPPSENYVFFSDIPEESEEQIRVEIIPKSVRLSHGPLPRPPASEFLTSNHTSLGTPPKPSTSESE